MSNISELANVPEISFIDGIALETIRDQMLSDYSTAYKEITGAAPSIASASPERIMLYAFAAQFYQGLQYVDMAGKMGLLKYSEGDYLDNLGANRGLTRAAATAATCEVQFTLSDVRTSATGIPGGTRLVAGDIYFATDEYLEIPAGEQTGTVTATAVTAGTDANGVAVGELDVIVDPVPYVASATNITTSAGGTSVESDDDFTRRIYLSSSGFSVAGPTDAYIYFAMQSRSDIGDVLAYSPAPTEVVVLFTLEDGSLPTEADIEAMYEVLSSDDIRPVADQLTVAAPEEVSYDITLTYYINTSDSAQATTIQTAVETAISDYQSWQRKIGRDISPSKLIQLIMAAGAKRVEVTAPVYTVVDEYCIAAAGTVDVTYGGLEDD